ncbi:M23 family metallopeptidase [Prolixibacter sp. NT017]|uniref:M23 family metallopeptidase n=1 Tax=Prolixibacter sp. NT017 TaxID=2652390 RepID=UPI00127104C4|nr:M23 family metallopeptidase [Prolixibacter sp. NT017]GET27735.1 peptidase [Prolixibacter sp. NT017]
MGKTNYRFNPETLSYDKIERNVKSLVKRLLGYLSTSIVLAVIISMVFLQFFDSPKLRRVKRENERLLTQYTLMNKDLDNMSKVLKDIQYRDDNIYRVIFEAEPIPASVRKAGFGGINRYSQLESMDNADLVISTARKLDVLTKQIYIQSKSYDDVMKMALNKEKMLASLPSIMPVSNKDLKRTASGWGYRIHPIYKIRKFHYGMDFSAPTGTEVFATGSGVVEWIRRSKIGFGNHILINHGYGFETLYAHLSAFNVKPGQKVKRGDVIGFVGSTGTSTAPHLHYEVHKNGKKVNPQNYYFLDLSPQEYEKMIEISSNMGQSFD